MSAKPVFNTLDGPTWAKALTAARKRRSGQGKRIAEAVKRHACAKCGGVGRYFYDENHAKPCEECCAHSAGWWQLTEAHQGYVAGADNACCRAGCGQMRRELTTVTTAGAVTKVNP
jgi:hypothetical protein